MLRWAGAALEVRKTRAVLLTHYVCCCACVVPQFPGPSRATATPGPDYTVGGSIGRQVASARPSSPTFKYVVDASQPPPLRPQIASGARFIRVPLGGLIDALLRNCRSPGSFRFGTASRDDGASSSRVRGPGPGEYGSTLICLYPTRSDGCHAQTARRDAKLQDGAITPCLACAGLRLHRCQCMHVLVLTGEGGGMITDRLVVACCRWGGCHWCGHPSVNHADGTHGQVREGHQDWGET